MSCKNKCCWWPHNWFCLKGLYWVFVALFYLTIVYAIYAVYAVSTSPMLSGAMVWVGLFYALVPAFASMLGFLTVAAILKALRKIVHAVAPCCCHEEKAEVPAPAVAEETK